MPLPRPLSITRSKLLVVEGRVAFVFFVALLRHLHLAETIQVLDFGSIYQFSPYLLTLTATPGFDHVTSLGIVRDAEVNAKSAFDSVCSALRKANLSVPKQLAQITGSTPHVSVFILPDGTNPGMLETLCLQSVINDPVLGCVEQFLECAKSVNAVPKNVDKARLHAFLATRLEADLLLGQAADAGYWPWNHPAFDSIKQFLRSL